MIFHSFLSSGWKDFQCAVAFLEPSNVLNSTAPHTRPSWNGGNLERAELHLRIVWQAHISLRRMDDFSHFPQHQLSISLSLSLSPSMSLWCHYNVCHDQGISKEVGTLPTSYLWTTIIPLKLDRRIKGNINNSIGATAGEDKGCKPLTKIHQRSTCPTIHPLIALYGYRAPRIIHFSPGELNRIDDHSNWNGMEQCNKYIQNN